MPNNPLRLTISLSQFNRAMIEMGELARDTTPLTIGEGMPRSSNITVEPILEEAPLIHANDDSCPCEAHKIARFEGSKLRNAVIHEYSYRPRGSWKFKSVGDNDPFNYYLGVELETDAHAVNEFGREEFSRILPEMAADMRRPKNLWVPKHDGSVTGPEFASHPATLTYWQKHRSKLEEMFQMLLHAGYRSHDNDTCGMHVNISRSAFEDPKHLFRFLTLIHANPKWSLRMSQRTKNSADHWANVETLQDPTRRARTSQRAFHPQGMTGLGRYMCLNAPRGEQRFEFRLPRGTLRVDRFFKNLEWTVGMIEFTRERTVKDAIPAKFMDWVLDNETRYPDLANYIAEKFSNSRALADAKAIPANVPDDESIMDDTRDIQQVRRGGPRIYTDDSGVIRYADGDREGERVRSTDTFMGDDGVVRYSRNGDRVGIGDPVYDPFRPMTYTDLFGTVRYSATRQRVPIEATYLDVRGRSRFVISNALV